MRAVFRRELVSYFTSPIGYVFLAVFYFFSGLFSYLLSVKGGTTDMSSSFSSLFIILVILIPILTMRIFSEERKQKTDQLLLTSPVSLTSLVTGKFLAAFVVYTLGVIINFVYAVIFSAFSTVSWTLFFGNILGLLLIGAAFIAIGVFVSSMTENQVVAAVSTFAVMLVILFIDNIASLLEGLNIKISFIEAIVVAIGKGLSAASIYQKYYDFCIGIIDFSSVLLMLSFVVVFLFLTIRSLEKRRWN